MSKIKELPMHSGNGISKIIDGVSWTFIPECNKWRNDNNGWMLTAQQIDEAQYMLNQKLSEK